MCSYFDFQRSPGHVFDLSKVNSSNDESSDRLMMRHSKAFKVNKRFFFYSS